MKSSPERAPARVLIAADSFKGCLASAQVCEALATGMAKGWPEAALRRLPVADGGEGTVTAIAAAHPEASVWERRTVRGPDGAMGDAPLLRLQHGETAVAELASAAGIQLVPSGAPLTASTWGVGQLIRAAAKGARRVLVGAGGSATLEGGAGALQALGFDLLDGHGAPIAPGLIGLETLRAIRPPDSAPAGVEILCDVRSPLLGPRGAAQMYGPQKGATPDMVVRAEAALDRYADLLAELHGRDPRTPPGAGAAGGFAGGMWAALGASLRPGFEGVAEMLGLERKIAEADWVVTGEGRLDDQTGQGKLVAGMQSQCAAAGVPLAVVVGQVTPKGRRWCEDNEVTLLELGDGTLGVQQRIERAYELLVGAGHRLTETLDLKRRA